MKRFWMPIIALLVALPMLGYVAGALSAARQEPRRYEAIVLRPVDGIPSSAAATATPGAGPTSLGLGANADDETEEIAPRFDDLEDDSDDAGRDGVDEGDRVKPTRTRGPGNPGTSGGAADDDDDDDDGRDSSGKDDDDDRSGKDDDGDDDRSGSNKDDNSGSGSDSDDDDDSEPDDD